MHKFFYILFFSFPFSAVLQAQDQHYVYQDSTLTKNVVIVDSTMIPIEDDNSQTGYGEPNHSLYVNTHRPLPIIHPCPMEIA